MRLSVAFITYNRKDELMRAIDSCLPLNEREAEIVIWDNHSDENNRRAIEKYVEDLEFPIQYVYGEANYGVAGGRNRVWKLCRGDYVFFLDDDAVIADAQPDPGIDVTHNPFFDNMICYMDEYTNVAAAGVNIPEPSTGNFLTCKQRYENEDGRMVTLLYVGAAHVLRKKAFKENQSLYPEKLVFGSEELYCAYTLWDEGYEVNEISDLTVIHLPSKVNRYAGRERVFQLIINQYIIKLLAAPRELKLLYYICFRLRLLKHGLEYRLASEIVSDRFNDKECRIMKFSTWVMLVRKFGFRSML